MQVLSTNPFLDRARRYELVAGIMMQTEFFLVYNRRHTGNEEHVSPEVETTCLKNNNKRELAANLLKLLNSILRLV